MMNDLEEQMRVAVAAWARDVFQKDEAVVGETDFEAEEETYLADATLRGAGKWRVAEVWVEAGTVVLINDLGEGYPMDDAPWPWTGGRTIKRSGAHSGRRARNRAPVLNVSHLPVSREVHHAAILPG